MNLNAGAVPRPSHVSQGSAPISPGGPAKSPAEAINAHVADWVNEGPAGESADRGRLAEQITDAVGRGKNDVAVDLSKFPTLTEQKLPKLPPALGLTVRAMSQHEQQELAQNAALAARLIAVAPAERPRSAAVSGPVLNAEPPPGAAPQANKQAGGPAAQVRQAANPAWEKEKDAFRVLCERWLKQLNAGGKKPTLAKLDHAREQMLGPIDKKRGSNVEQLELFTVMVDQTIQWADQDQQVIILSAVLSRLQLVGHAAKSTVETRILMMAPDAANKQGIQQRRDAIANAPQARPGLIERIRSRSLGGNARQASPSPAGRRPRSEDAAEPEAEPADVPALPLTLQGLVDPTPQTDRNQLDRRIDSLCMMLDSGTLKSAALLKFCEPIIVTISAGNDVTVKLFQLNHLIGRLMKYENQTDFFGELIMPAIRALPGDLAVRLYSDLSLERTRRNLANGGLLPD